MSEGKSKHYSVENCRFTCTYVPGISTSLPNTRDFPRLINTTAGNSIDQQASLCSGVWGGPQLRSLDECVKLLLEYDSPLPTTPPLTLVLDISFSLHQLAVRAPGKPASQHPRMSSLSLPLCVKWRRHEAQTLPGPVAGLLLSQVSTGAEMVGCLHRQPATALSEAFLRW